MNVSKGRLPVKGRRLATWAGSTTCYGCSLDKPCQLLPSYADCVIQTCPLPLYGCLLWQAYWLPPVSSRTVQSQVWPVFLVQTLQNCNLRIAENEKSINKNILENMLKSLLELSFPSGRMNAGRIGGRGSRGNLVEDEGFRFGDEAWWRQLKMWIVEVIILDWWLLVQFPERVEDGGQRRRSSRRRQRSLDGGLVLCPLVCW